MGGGKKGIGLRIAGNREERIERRKGGNREGERKGWG